MTLSLRHLRPFGEISIFLFRFIAKAASVSSTSGKPYLIRFKDGREVKCGDYLKERLKNP